MSNCYIIVEGKTDATILDSVLSAKQDAVKPEIKTGNGRSSAISLARTMLVSREGSLVVLLLDADSTNPERVRELQVELEESLSDVSRETRFRVVLLEPSIESLLFHDRKGLEHAIGSAISETEEMQSRYDPKAVLDGKLRANGKRYDPATLEAILKQLNMRKILQDGKLQELTQFISKPPTAASV